MTAPNPTDSLLRRMRLVLWKQHQPFIALLLVGCLIGMCSFFWYRSVLTNGIIDIDRAPAMQADFKVDINVAQWPEIVVLPGVGEKLARAIVEHRQHIGSFKSLDEIQEVPGIGERKLEQLRPFLLPIRKP